MAAARVAVDDEDGDVLVFLFYFRCMAPSRYL